jgi:hypothetical protein
MNQLRHIQRLFQQWNAVLPLLSMLLGIAIHDGFRQGDIAYLVISVVVATIVYTVAPFMDLVRATRFAPLALGVIYGCIPYLFGLSTLGVLPAGVDFMWLAALSLLGASTMVLYGLDEKPVKNKPAASALAEQLGTDWICFVGLICAVAGSLLIIWQVRNALWLVTIVALYLGALAFCIVQLADIRDRKTAYATIITSVTTLHGLLVTLIIAYTFIAGNAGTTATTVATGIVTVFFMSIFLLLVAKPRLVVGKHR